VESAQLQLARERDAEREGWHDFQEQVASRVQRAAASEQEELEAAAAELAKAHNEAEALVANKQYLRLQLDQAGRRLEAMSRMAGDPPVL